MIRNLKVLGLALVAVFAMSALSATGASAQFITPTTGKVVTLDAVETGSNGNRFTWAANDYVDCVGSTITGHKKGSTTKPKAPVDSGDSTVTLTPNFINCLAHNSSGAHKATVTMTSCDFEQTITATTGVATGTYGVESSVVCNTEGDSIHIDVYPFAGSELGGIVCSITIKEQSDLTGAHATNTPEEDFDISGEITGIHAERSGSACATETNANTIQDIDATVEGTDVNGNPVGVTISD